MHWKVAEAKQKLSDIVRQAAREPQLIYNRDRLVAAIVDAQTFAAFQAWCEQNERRSLADAFAELRQIADEEHYSLDLPPRLDRAKAFVDVGDDVSG
jgi:PHD/YefM family antitoxin component YafN of YafNO toxin-antitoxin module